MNNVIMKKITLKLNLIQMNSDDLYPQVFLGDTLYELNNFFYYI